MYLTRDLSKDAYIIKQYSLLIKDNNKKLIEVINLTF